MVLVLLLAQRKQHSSEDGGHADTEALIGSARARLLLANGFGKLAWACQMKEERLTIAYLGTRALCLVWGTICATRVVASACRTTSSPVTIEGIL